MKVLAIGGQLDRCESYMLSRFAELGVSVTAIVDPDQVNEQILNRNGVEVVRYKIRGKINPFAIGFLRPFFSRRDFDIVHCFSSHALGNVLMASAGTKIRRVAYRGTSGHMSRLDPSSWLTYLHPSLHKIICVSHAVERYFADKRVPEQRLVAIHKGHDVAWYADSAVIDLSEFGVPPGAFVVSCVANMRPVKGVDYLINALRALPPELPIHLLLIGEIRDERITALEKEPAFVGRLHFTGYRSDAPTLVGASHCFVMPSVKREGLPKALIEAMAKGVAPIITNIGGMPEVVRHEVEGLVVPGADSAALGEAILRLYHSPDLVKKFGRASYERIVNDFNIEQTVQKTLRVYEDLLS